MSTMLPQDSDQQQIQTFELNGPILTITLENGGKESVDLSTYDGIQGPVGPVGSMNTDGQSAYEVLLNKGNSGTKQDFLDSLKGADGATGLQGPSGGDGSNGLSAYEIWLQEGNLRTE